MKDKISLYAVLTIVALLGCLGRADAQGTPSKPPTPPILITPELHNELTQDGTVSEGAGFSSTEARTSATGVTAAVLGWNYVHATNCIVYWDGTTAWLYVFPQEGGFWFTSNLSAQNVISPACQTGNWVAFYVVNTTGGLWNQVLTFTFK